MNEPLCKFGEDEGNSVDLEKKNQSSERVVSVTHPCDLEKVFLKILFHVLKIRFNYFGGYNFKMVFKILKILNCFFFFKRFRFVLSIKSRLTLLEEVSRVSFSIF